MAQGPGSTRPSRLAGELAGDPRWWERGEPLLVSHYLGADPGAAATTLPRPRAPATVHSSWHRGSGQGPPKMASSEAGLGLPNRQSRGSQASRGHGRRVDGCAFTLSDQKPTATQITTHPG